MDDGLKQRLVGALVLTGLAVIFLPSLFKRDDVIAVDDSSRIPPSPDVKPIVIPEPTRPENIAPAPPPEQAFQPEEETPPPSPVVTETAEPPDLDSTGIAEAWTVQVASFAEPERAKKLKDELLATDYKSYLRVLKTDKGEVTRVFIGPHIDRQTALVIKQKVDEELSVSSLILRFTP